MAADELIAPVPGAVPGETGEQGQDGQGRDGQGRDGQGRDGQGRDGQDHGNRHRGDPGQESHGQHDQGEEDRELLARWRSSAPGSAARDRACEALVRRYEFLVRTCVRRYQASPVPQEELMQVGYIGLLKAINKFDPALGSSLSAYAEPCIRGELKRFFRDKRWHVHVRRAAQELRLELRASRAELAQRLSRQPAAAELASYAGVTPAEVADAERAERAFEAASLDAPLADGFTLADTLGAEDPGMEFVLDMTAVWQHWHELPEREQRLLLLRFYGELTQSEIGERLGMSQMQVSRLLSRSLRYLRDRLLAAEGQVSLRSRGPASSS